MKLMVPDYYAEFRCIAGACRHSCCIGWEIDIDVETAENYRQMTGMLGEMLRRATATAEDETTHFCLTEGERCPMLRADGLCEIICKAGEEQLCQICTDHPRWRNFFSDRTEMGLGLCCEEAARLIVNRKTSGRFVLVEEDLTGEENAPEEDALLAFRDALLERLQDRQISIIQRFSDCAAMVGRTLTFSGVLTERLLRPLERLEKDWDTRLDMLAAEPDWPAVIARYPQQAENLAVCLLMRHLSGALEDGMTAERAMLALWGTILVLCVSRDANDIADAARQFSGEIEYSDENLWAVLEWLGGMDGTDALL